eukprot:1051653-Amphidinium_carterae.1
MDRSRTPARDDEAYLTHVLALHADSQQERPKLVKRGSEVDYFSLPETLKQHYRQAMAKEWNSWKTFSAVDLIPRFLKMLLLYQLDGFMLTKLLVFVEQ